MVDVATGVVVVVRAVFTDFFRNLVGPPGRTPRQGARSLLAHLGRRRATRGGRWWRPLRRLVSLTSALSSTAEMSGYLVGSAAFKAVGMGDPHPAGSIPVHLRQSQDPAPTRTPRGFRSGAFAIPVRKSFWRDRPIEEFTARISHGYFQISIWLFRKASKQVRSNSERILVPLGRQ